MIAANRFNLHTLKSVKQYYRYMIKWFWERYYNTIIKISNKFEKLLDDLPIWGNAMLYYIMLITDYS